MNYTTLSTQFGQASSCLLNQQQQERPRIELQLENLMLILKEK
jgi:hypothetical protein